MVRAWARWVWWCVLCVLAACSGAGGPQATAPTESAIVERNAQELVVDSGPQGLTTAMVNLPYTRVRICIPGTQQCQTVEHVLVDTGSTGLRLLESAVSLALPGVSKDGQPLYNCVQFIDQSFMWGRVARADVHLGGENLDGETAAGVPVQLVGGAAAPAAPLTCAPTGFMSKDTLDTLGANGVLGVGHYPQDCGERCTRNADNGYYYIGSASGMTGTAVGRNEQLQQPVSLFEVNNNGVLISLPAVAPSGAAVVSGTLIFGIGTQSNNLPEAVSLLTFNTSGYFTTELNGSTMTKGFVDSGSNAWFFGTSAYPLCERSAQWYCPSSGTVALQAINTGANHQTSAVDFWVTDATSLLTRAPAAALSTLAGPIGDGLSFDFGLPFFYGRRVFSAIEGRPTPLGPGPYVAYR